MLRLQNLELSHGGVTGEVGAGESVDGKKMSTSPI